MSKHKKTIIMIGHQKRQGKDTFAEMLSNLTGGEIIRFADPMKHILADTFGISYEDLDRMKNSDRYLMHDNLRQQSYRDILQRFGSEGMKNQFGDDLWAKLAAKKAKQCKSDIVIIPDFRFIVEFLTMLDAFGADNLITINVIRPGFESTDTHKSETQLNTFKYDMVIENSGTLEDLRSMAEKAHKTFFRDKAPIGLDTSKLAKLSTSVLRTMLSVKEALTEEQCATIETILLLRS